MVSASGVAGECTWKLSGGVLTISGSGALSGEVSFASYADDIEEVIVESSACAVENGFFDCFADKAVTFVTYPTCSAATEVRKLQKNNENIVLTYDASLSREGTQDVSDWIGDGNTSYFWSFDESTGKLTIDSSDRYMFICLSYSGVTLFNAWKNIWNDAIYSIEFGSIFTELKVDNVSWFSYGLKNLKSVKFNSSSVNIYDASESYYNGKGIFEGCSSLTTVGVGENYEEGVVNLTNIKMTKHAKCTGWQNMFKGCSSVTKVVYDIASGSTETNIVPNSFAGCTSLNEIIIGANVTGLKASAFAGCTALEKVEFRGTGFAVESTAFDADSDLRIYVLSNSDKDNLLASCANLTDSNIDIVVSGVDGDCTWTLSGDTLTIFGSGSLSDNGSWSSYASDIRTVIVESTIGTVSSEYFASLADKTVTFVTYPTCSAATVVRNMQKSNKNITLAYDSSVSRSGAQENSTYTYTFVIDEAGKLVITSTGSTGALYYASWDKVHTKLMAFKNIWRDAITSVEIYGFTYMRNEHTGEWFFSGLPNLVSVKFGVGFGNITEGVGSSYNPKGIFEGCTSLTTVGVEGYYAEGVINLSGIKFGAGAADCYDRLFKDCTSVKKVVYNLNVGSNEDIPENAFSGCTSLAEISIGANIDSILGGAFNGCTALNKIVLANVNATISADAFTSCSGIKLHAGNFEQATVIGENLAFLGIGEAVVTVVATVGGMSVDGFQVRTSGKNGLRVRFKFDESIFDGENNGYTFVEYGAVVASMSNYNNYTHDVGGANSILVSANGEFTTSDERIKKIAVKSAEGFNADAYYNVNGDSVEFNVAIVNYSTKHQAMSNVAIVGYEIWEKNGEYFAFFTEQTSEDYAELSLYKVTVGMLDAGAITLEANEESPVYKTVELCAESKVDTDIENVSAFVLKDPVSDGKYIVAFVNAGGELAEIETLSFIDGDIRNNISRIVCGKNVLQFTLPEIAEYWQEYIDEKLAGLEEGKQFIYLVDTHWEGNQKKSTDLIQYVRKMTGIKTVIHAGDPFDGYNLEATAKSEAEKMIVDAMYDNFYKIYGSNGLYAIGNHDTNRAGLGTALKDWATNGVDNYKVSVANSFIYEKTLSNLEGRVQYDTALIEKINSGAITFAPHGDYSAEDMKNEAIAWAKQHYTYDDDVQKIRYIVLDTGDGGLVSKLVLGQDYGGTIPTQYDWLAEVLLDTAKNKADYDIVVIGHMLGLAQKTQATGTAPESIHHILSAFKSGSVASFKVDKGNANFCTVVGDLNKSYDFSECSGFEGTVFTMHGHWHHDYNTVYEVSDNSFHTYTDDYVMTEGSVLDISCIPDATIGGYVNESIYPKQSKGTTGEQSFNIVTIKDNGEIIVTRIGLGEDKVLNSK